jgi:hypothetical protein
MDIREYKFHLLVNLSDSEQPASGHWRQWIEDIIGPAGINWQYYNFTSPQPRQILVGFKCSRHLKMFALFCRYNGYNYVMTHSRQDFCIGPMGQLHLPVDLERSRETGRQRRVKSHSGR